MCTSITIESVGRRHYFRGNTYPVKDALRNGGAKWDADQKAWWTGKRELAEQLVTKCCSSSVSSSSSTSSREAPGKDGIVAGKATYKGRTYYVAGRVVRGRTHWDDTVEGITTRDGDKVLLYFRDGSKSFWALRSEIQVVKSYQRGATIGKLESLSQEWREARAKGGCACACHREPNAGAPGSTLYDGCDRCGCEAC